MPAGFSPWCACCSCTVTSFVNPTDNATAYLASCTVLEGSYWNVSGGFIRWQGSLSGGSTGRLLLPGSSTTEEVFVRAEFNSIPGGSNDSIVTIFPTSTATTPGPYSGSVRTGGSGHSTVTGAESKEILFPWAPDAGATMEVCVQKQPNSSHQYYISLAWDDATSTGVFEGAEVLTDLITSSPTGNRVIIEANGSADIVFSAIEVFNYKNGASVCQDCAQDCGCPSCTMTVTVGGVANDGSSTFACADDGSEDKSAAICSNANRQYILPGYNMPYGGLGQCFWLDCIPLLTDLTACHILIVVRMAFDPPSGITRVTAVIAVATDACVGECAVPTEVTSIGQILASLSTCGKLCSVAAFSATSESGGNRVGCGFLEDLELTLDPTDSEWSDYIADGSCCAVSSATFTINDVGFDCGQGSEGPLVVLQGPGESVVGCAATTPDTGNGTDFGSVAVGSNVTHTFTIKNTGTEDLHISTVTVTGSTDFAISSNVGSTTISAGSSETFTVKFAPTIGGIDCNTPELAWVEFATDVFGTPLCWFAVSGKNSGGIMAVTDASSHAIANDPGGSPSSTNHTDFGTVALGSGISNTYTITNSGSSTNYLALGVVSVGGADAGDVIVTSQPGSTLLAPGATTTFAVEFAPILTGTRTAQVIIPNSDCADGNPYVFNVKGVGTGDSPTEPPACPFSGKTAYLTLTGVPSGDCPGCEGTYSAPLTSTSSGFGPGESCTECIFENDDPAGDCGYTLVVSVIYCFDSDGNPATYISVNIDTSSDMGVELNWNSPGIGTAVAGSSPLIISGWLTTITSLNLGAPTSAGCTDSSAIGLSITVS